MAAPKNPNVTAANRANLAKGNLRASNRLAEAGYLVLSPDELARLTPVLRRDLAVVLALFDIRVPRALTEVTE